MEEYEEDHTWVELILPGCVIGSIWVTIIVLMVIIYISKSKPKEYWFIKYYNCDKTTVKYKYIVRLIIDTPLKVQKVNTYEMTFTVNTEDKKTLADIVLNGSELQSYSTYDPKVPNKSVIHFLLYTQESIEAMGLVVLNLKNTGWLKVFEVEIQPINSLYANTGIVGLDIRRMSAKGAAEQQSALIIKTIHRPIEESAFPSRLLTSYECLLFIWWTINLIAFLSTTLIICSTTKETPDVLCDDFNRKYVSTAYTGLVASVVSALSLTVVIAFYRYLIKYYYEMNFDSNLWYGFRFVYLSAVIITGIGTGITAAYIVTTHKHKTGIKSIDFIVFWFISLMIGFAIFLLFWMPVLAVCGNCFDFFSISDEYKDNEEKIVIKERNVSKIFSERIQPKNKPSGAVPQEDREESNNYFKQLMKDGHKVKSISQYKGPQKTASPQQDNSSDDQSLGNTYWNQLMKNQAKVTSVSKYGHK